MSARHAMSEESRLQIAVVAGATERSNRPRFLLVLAGLLMAAAVVYAAMQAQSLAAARLRIGKQQQTMRQVSALVTELRAAHAAQTLDALPRDAETTAKLERLAKSTGLPETIRIDEVTRGAGAAGFIKKVYTTRFRAPDVGLVLDWLVEATSPNNSAGLSGIEVSQIKLRPQLNVNNGGWDVDIVLSRIERGN